MKVLVRRTTLFDDEKPIANSNKEKYIDINGYEKEAFFTEIHDVTTFVDTYGKIVVSKDDSNDFITVEIYDGERE